VGVIVGISVAVSEGVAAIARVDIGLGIGLTAVPQAERSAAATRRVNNLFINLAIAGIQLVTPTRGE
jgi:hypothetical protein